MPRTTTAPAKNHIRRRHAAPGTQTRTDHDWQYLACQDGCGEEVRVPKNVTAVTCSRCIMKKVPPPEQRAPKAAGEPRERPARKVVAPNVAAAVLERLRKNPEQSLWAESQALGFNSNDPLRSALRLLMGKAEYAEFMKQRGKPLLVQRLAKGKTAKPVVTNAGTVGKAKIPNGTKGPKALQKLLTFPRKAAKVAKKGGKAK